MMVVDVGLVLISRGMKFPIESIFVRFQMEQMQLTCLLSPFVTLLVELDDDGVVAKSRVDGRRV